MTCSFTGHRQIEPEMRQSLTELISKAVEYAYSEGCRDFICGGALGFDTLAAREVIRFRMTHADVRLLLALPCTNQDDMWSERQRDTYNYTLSVADEVIYVSDLYTPTCMAERNSLLAERADILIAYLGRQRSGAAQTVRMAQRLGKRIYNLYPSLHKNEG
ncbi:MAG: DUF1273 family protein [Clostridia bacterium]|nr:DUF1273 family protein [Clostridia bacterium]